MRRELVKGLHYRCEKISSECLKIYSKDYGNKVSNRKNNNQWKRRILKNKVKMLCVMFGIEFVEVNPAYTSFIGNMIYEYYDSVNASIEIARRGCFKFVKGKFYPSMQRVKGSGSTLETNEVSSYQRKESLTNNLSVSGCDTWVKLYKKMRDMRYCVLPKLDKLRFFRHSSTRSYIDLYNFI